MCLSCHHGCDRGLRRSRVSCHLFAHFVFSLFSVLILSLLWAEVGLAGCLILRLHLEVFAVLIPGSKGINSHSLLIVVKRFMFCVKINYTIFEYVYGSGFWQFYLVLRSFNSFKNMNHLIYPSHTCCCCTRQGGC